MQMLGIVIFVALAGYMFYFLRSSTVASSNIARQSMLDISWSYWQRSPWIGYGPNTFITLLSETKYFVMEFGDPLDAHGFLSKIIVEEGLFGLAFFLLFLGTVIKKIAISAREHSEQAVILSHCLLAMVLGIIMFELFNTAYFASTMWLPIGIALAGTGLIMSKKYDGA